jgi:predicted dithiol-disulfide oxidoreductase (DUF899 family)
MKKKKIPHTKIVSRDRWLSERMKLLAHEKALTKQHDRVSAERRRLPMVKIAKDYVFDGPKGKLHLKDFFDGRRQLIIYHFMFDPAWDKGCPACTSYVDALGDLSMLNERDTTFVLVSRAPLAKLKAYKAQRGWSIPWFSSFGSDFNYDFHVTLDEKVAPLEHNYLDKAGLEKRKKDEPYFMQGEQHATSSHLLGLRAGHRRTDRRLCPTRYDTLRAAAGVRGLASRLATEADIWVNEH